MPQPRILVLVGTKAQFVKVAPVLLAMDERSIPYTLMYSGQHSETFDDMEAAFGTRSPELALLPDYEADTHFSFAVWCLKFWRNALKQPVRRRLRQHSIILVHGDTASTLFGAILGRIFGLEVAHIEAGLRSPSLFDPFPEELIRRWTSRLASIHYCPDDWACSNLENVSGEKIDTRGNTLCDSLRTALARLEYVQPAGHEPAPGPGAAFGIVSLHRNENLSRARRFQFLMETIEDVARIHPIKFVMHPATRQRLMRTRWYEKLDANPNVELVNRMDYFKFIALMARARFLMTDGGSNQEEASQIGIPCLLLRRSTERRDGLGRNVVLSNLDRDVILDFAKKNGNSPWQISSDARDAQSPSQIIAESLSAKF